LSPKCANELVANIESCRDVFVTRLIKSGLIDEESFTLDSSAVSVLVEYLVANTSRQDSMLATNSLAHLGDNRTDLTILNHIMSLIAEGESPPDVKIFTKPTGAGPTYSTHVEVHKVHRIAKRAAHHDGTDHAHNHETESGIRARQMANDGLRITTNSFSTYQLITCLTLTIMVRLNQL